MHLCINIVIWFNIGWQNAKSGSAGVPVWCRLPPYQEKAENMETMCLSFTRWNGTPCRHKSRCHHFLPKCQHHWLGRGMSLATVNLIDVLSQVHAYKIIMFVSEIASLTPNTKKNHCCLFTLRLALYSHKTNSLPLNSQTLTFPYYI